MQKDLIQLTDIALMISLARIPPTMAATGDSSPARLLIRSLQCVRVKRRCMHTHEGTEKLHNYIQTVNEKEKKGSFVLLNKSITQTWNVRETLLGQHSLFRFLEGGFILGLVSTSK